VEREGELWQVRGAKPERWVRQTDFSNAEAVGYLADRLNRIGIEDRLLELGAQPGDGVAIGGANAVIFDFAPQVDIGAEVLSPRGADQRLLEERPAAQRRREKDRAYHAADEASEEPDEAPNYGSSTGLGHVDPGVGQHDA
jgi:GTP-binding protein